jgi:hypothetical protein
MAAAVVLDRADRVLHLCSRRSLLETQCGVVMTAAMAATLSTLLDRDHVARCCPACWPEAQILPFAPRGHG